MVYIIEKISLNSKRIAIYSKMESAKRRLEQMFEEEKNTPYHVVRKINDRKIEVMVNDRFKFYYEIIAEKIMD